MAVEIKYVVVRKGQEKMAFANKKDADAYDKMLDLAEVLGDWLQQGPLALEDSQRDELAGWMAKNRDALMGVLKNGKLPLVTAADAPSLCPAELSESVSEDNVSQHPGRMRRTKAA